MKQYRLHAMMVILLVVLTSGLVLSQDATEEPANMEALAPSMEYALVPCTDDVTGPCDVIATSADDIVGVWKQYLGNPMLNAADGMGYIRYNADGTYNIADSIENTATPFENYPFGTFTFDGSQFIIAAISGAPAPCDGPGIFQLRVLKYDDKPVALRYVPISDTCAPRLQDLSQALIWVAE